MYTVFLSLAQEKKLVLTVPDLSRALGDQGVTVARPQYYI